MKCAADALPDVPHIGDRLVHRLGRGGSLLLLVLLNDGMTICWLDRPPSSSRSESPAIENPQQGWLQRHCQCWQWHHTAVDSMVVQEGLTPRAVQGRIGAPPRKDQSWTSACPWSCLCLCLSDLSGLFDPDVGTSVVVWADAAIGIPIGPNLHSCPIGVIGVENVPIAAEDVGLEDCWIELAEHRSDLGPARIHRSEGTCWNCTCIDANTNHNATILSPSSSWLSGWCIEAAQDPANDEKTKLRSLWRRRSDKGCRPFRWRYQASRARARERRKARLVVSFVVTKVNSRAQRNTNAEKDELQDNDELDG